MPEVGLVTNLYHMPRALAAFSALELQGLCRVTPVFAEDFAILLPDNLAPGGGAGWVEDILGFYSDREPRLSPEQLRAILEARRSGALPLSACSVGELLSASGCGATGPNK